MTWQTLILLILSTPIQFGVGGRFYRAAYLGLKHRNCGMDFLIAMGTTAAYGYSIVSIIAACMLPGFHGHHFFETSALLLTFVVMGKTAEAIARGKTSDALTNLMKLQPLTALLRTSAPGAESGKRGASAEESAEGLWKEVDVSFAPG